MRIELSESSVTTGHTVHGKVVGRSVSDLPKSVLLYQRQRGGDVDQRRALKEAPVDRDDGSFTVVVPRHAAPTIQGENIHVEWHLEASTGGPGQHTASADLTVSRSPGETPALWYEVGDSPAMPEHLRRRMTGDLLQTVGLAVLLGFCTAALAVMSREASPFARALGLSFPLLLFLVSLGAAALYSATLWPRTIPGFVPTIEPAVVNPGSSVTVVSSDPFPDDLRLLCIETFGETLHSSDHDGGTTRDRTTHRSIHPAIRPSVEGNAYKFPLPAEAIPTYEGPAGQVTWVLRRGGRTFMRFGPFRYRDWAVIVR